MATVVSYGSSRVLSTFVRKNGPVVVTGVREFDGENWWSVMIVSKLGKRLETSSEKTGRTGSELAELKAISHAIVIAEQHKIKRICTSNIALLRLLDCAVKGLLLPPGNWHNPTLKKILGALQIMPGMSFHLISPYQKLESLPGLAIDRENYQKKKVAEAEDVRVTPSGGLRFVIFIPAEESKVALFAGHGDAKEGIRRVLREWGKEHMP